jgi:hypothetical protein
MFAPFRLAFPDEMSRVNPAELPGSMAVLGIVIEQPNDTVKHVGQCLDRRFTRARFARSTAHSTLPRLAHARRVRRTHQASGTDRSKDRYEATANGVEVFRTWMFELPSGTPALRDAMYGRIELCRLEDLPRLIVMARQEEAVSADLYAEAALKLRQQIAARDRGPTDYERQVREVLLYADPMHWASRSERYKVIADRLEEIAQEILDLDTGAARG